MLKVHDPAPVSPSHTRPFFTQISTHAVHRAWSRARVRDNNFTSGGRGPLHGRRSRSEGIIMHSTAAQSPFRQRACPSQPSCCPVHRRSYFRWTPTRVRRGTRSLCPTGTGTRAYASEMHCTIAHRLTSHTHVILRVHQQNQQTRGFHHETHPSFLASRASYGEADRGRCHFPAAKLVLRAVRRARAACSKT